MSKIIGYKVTDTQSGIIVKMYRATTEEQLERKYTLARRYANKRDMEYGAYRYHVSMLTQGV